MRQCITHTNKVTAVDIPGKYNVVTDRESQVGKRDME